MSGESVDTAARERLEALVGKCRWRQGLRPGLRGPGAGWVSFEWLRDGVWKLWREGEPVDQRFTGRFSEGGDTISGRWEAREPGGDWRIDFDLTYRRVR